MPRNFNQWQYPQKVDVISTAGERITPDKWTGYYPSKIARKVLAVAVIPAVFFVNIEPLVAEVITVDKWFNQTSLPVRSVAKTVDFNADFEPPQGSVKDGIENLGYSKVQPEIPALPDTRQYRFPTVTPDQISQDALEAEKAEYQWRGNFYDNPVLPGENRWTYPSLFGDADLFEVPGIEPVTIDRFYIQQSEPVRVKQPIILEEFTQPPPQSVDDGISQLGWRPNFYDNPVLPENNRWTYPELFQPPSRDALEPEISRLGWRPNFYDNPILPEENQWTYPTLFGFDDLFEVPGVEDITVDKWFVQASEPRRDPPPKPLEGYAESPSRNAIETETSKLEWRGNFYDNPVLPKDFRWTYPSFMADAQLHEVPVGPTTFVPKTFSVNLHIDQGRDRNLYIDQGRNINLNRC